MSAPQQPHGNTCSVGVALAEQRRKAEALVIAESRGYEKPRLVEYGSLAELTRANTLTDMEDGTGKITNTDGNSGFSPTS